jgi:hypothetical protein
MTNWRMFHEYAAWIVSYLTNRLDIAMILGIH